MDATVNTTDCSCMAVMVPEAQRCNLRLAYCVIIQPLPDDPNRSNASLGQLRYRARAWDLANPGYTGASAGWGAGAGGGAADSGTAMVQAANNLRARFPARNCGRVTPIVIVPGFSSSLVE